MMVSYATRTSNADAGAERFARRMLATLNEAGVALMTSVGHRTRLFDVMAKLGPGTSQEIATGARLNERYVREWLGAMTAGGIVDYDPIYDAYSLPSDRAASLTGAGGTCNLAASMQWISVLGGVEDAVVAAFVDGRGVPYSAYKRFHEVMAEESAQTVVAALDAHLLPLVPGLREALTEGIDVLDVGCGSGQAMIHLAREFPASRFTGYDLCDETIALARMDARWHGLGNVRFEQLDVSEITERSAYDLVFAFDAIHDQARPQNVLANVHRALKPEGLFYMQDVKSNRHTDDGDSDPASGPFAYAMSCMHRLSGALADRGAGPGTAPWGRRHALKLLQKAGFTDVTVHELPHDLMNDYYLAPKR